MKACLRETQEAMLAVEQTIELAVSSNATTAIDRVPQPLNELVAAAKAHDRELYAEAATKFALQSEAVYDAAAYVSAVASDDAQARNLENARTDVHRLAPEVVAAAKVRAAVGRPV